MCLRTQAPSRIYVAPGACLPQTKFMAPARNGKVRWTASKLPFLWRKRRPLPQLLHRRAYGSMCYSLKARSLSQCSPGGHAPQRNTMQSFSVMTTESTGQWCCQCGVCEPILGAILRRERGPLNQLKPGGVVGCAHGWGAMGPGAGRHRRPTVHRAPRAPRSLTVRVPVSGRRVRTGLPCGSLWLSVTSVPYAARARWQA